MLQRLAACAVGVTVLYGPMAVQATPFQPVAANIDSRAPASLQSALAEAWRRHPDSTAIDARIVAARARLTAAGRPIYNPEAEFAADDNGPDRTLTGGIKLTLDLGGKRGARRDAASARLNLSEMQARIVRRDFARRWLASLADVLSSRERLRIGERRLDAVRRFADIAKKQFAAQDISGLERDLAQLALDEALAEQSTLVSEQADAQARFRAVGGDPDSTMLAALPTTQLPDRVPATTDIARLPDLQAAQAEALAVQREIAVAKKNRIADPTVGIRAGTIQYDGRRRDRVAGISVSFPLHVRNSYRAEVSAAEADAAVADAEVARLRLQLEADQRSAIAGYAAARSAWTQWSSSRGTDGDRRGALLEKLLRGGDISPSDFLLQLRQTLDTQLAGAALEARVWRSWTDSLAATGQLERWAGLVATP
ncbi:TolC family protein [Solilutibacter silvestris]|uniref:TolC family protein n=1 Tax=Solilutibacter silvestris TaxID=1645665 RepID=UPI003D33CC11